jgi:transcriptional regulator GlxA family with amidase domain
LADANSLDILFVVAGYGARAHATPSLVKALQLATRKIPTLGGLDSGAWILAVAGLLDGHRATIHWQDLGQFAETHLGVQVTAERFIIDRDRITAGGAASVTDLTLKLIEDRGGGALAFDVTNMFVHDSRPPMSASQTGTTPVSQLYRAVTTMRANVEKPLRIETVAERAALSLRTLSRLFKREFGTGPGRYYQNIRLDVARSLVEETSLGASEIAARTGFSSASCLSRAYSLHFRHSLREARRNRRVKNRA